MLIVFFLSIFLGFDTLNWLLTKFFAISILVFVILFQQEIRQGLARLGQGHLFTMFMEESDVIAIIDEISDAVFKLADKKTGCLIALEREANDLCADYAQRFPGVKATDDGLAMDLRRIDREGWMKGWRP